MTATTPLTQELDTLRGHARARLDELRGAFDAAWVRREIVRALHAFQRFREALARTLAWEEEPLAAATRPEVSLVAQRHRRHHAQMQKLCIDILELLARRIWMGGCVDGDIDDRLAALDHLLDQHRRGFRLPAPPPAGPACGAGGPGRGACDP